MLELFQIEVQSRLEYLNGFQLMLFKRSTWAWCVHAMIVACIANFLD